jgi:hypothetical protein
MAKRSLLSTASGPLKTVAAVRGSGPLAHVRRRVPLVNTSTAFNPKRHRCLHCPLALILESNFRSKAHISLVVVRADTRITLGDSTAHLLWCQSLGIIYSSSLGHDDSEYGWSVREEYHLAEGLLLIERLPGM